MGAWGHKSFENDDALDFVWQFEESGMSAIESAFTLAINPPDDYLEAPEASAALAAAEYVAAKKTGQTDRLIHDHVDLVEKIESSPKLIGDAKNAVSRILQNSELRELWEESDELNIWHDDVLVLLERLK